MKLDVIGTLKELYSISLKDLGAYGGGPFYVLLIIAALLVGGYGFAYKLIMSLVVVTAIVAVIRLAYFKPRPGMKKKAYSDIYERVDNSSFPSIHSARAVLLSFAIYSVMPQALPLVVLLSLIVFASRLHLKRHDMKDIAVGIIIGLVLGMLFFY